MKKFFKDLPYSAKEIHIRKFLNCKYLEIIKKKLAERQALPVE